MLKLSDRIPAKRAIPYLFHFLWPSAITSFSRLNRFVTFPVNTKHLNNVCTMFGQRGKRWADVVQMLCKCFVFAGMASYLTSKWTPRSAPCTAQTTFTGRTLTLLLLIFKSLNELAPSYLSCKDLRYANRHLLVIPQTRYVNVADRSFAKVSPFLWNALPLPKDL